jgi:ATP-dependent RNA helicase DDX5/DBP2
MDERGGGRGPVEPVFIDWKPSERVLALTEEQISDIKQRLNVTVEVPEGQPPAASPIESFQEMVSPTLGLQPQLM